MRAILLRAFGIGVAAILVLPAGRAAADGVSGEAAIGVEGSTKDYDNAKFREYWYDMHSQFAVFPEGSIRYEHGGTYVSAGLGARTGTEGQSQDGALRIDAGTYGLFSVQAEYKRIGHNFAYDSKTLYAGLGTGELKLADEYQLTNQGSLSSTEAALHLSDEEANAWNTELGLKRDRVRASAEWVSLRPFTLGVDVSGERRVGTRPYGGTFGFGNAVEIAEPIDYQTLDFSLRAGWSEKIPVLGGLPAYAQLSGGRSQFKNSIESVLYDNPFRFTDTTTASAYAATYAAGAAQGRNALPPSNTSDRGDLSVGVTLPARIRLAGSAHYAVNRQDEAFLPQTTNTAITTAPLPRGSLEGKVVDSRYEVSLAASPVKRAQSKLKFEYLSHKNLTEEWEDLEWVAADATYHATSDGVEWVGYDERRIEFEQSYELTRRNLLSLSLGHAHATFVNGSANTEDENRAKLTFDSRALDWATFKVSGEHALRESDYPDYTGTVYSGGELPWMRKFYAADRDQDRLVAMVTVLPTDELTVSAEQIVGESVYPKSRFGRQNEGHMLSSIAMDYQPADGASFGAFFTQESFRNHQRSRQWSPRNPTTGAPPVSDPYDQSAGIEDYGNWEADTTDVVRTLGLSNETALVPQKVTWRTEGMLTQNQGAIRLSSPVYTGTSATAFDANPFIPQDFPQVDSARGASLGTSVRWQATRAVAAIVGYRYDVWKIDGFQYEGYTTVAENTRGQYSGLFSMDTLPKNYEVHTVYATVRTKF